MQEDPYSTELQDVLQRTYDTYAYLSEHIQARQLHIANQLTQIRGSSNTRSDVSSTTKQEKQGQPEQDQNTTSEDATISTTEATHEGSPPAASSSGTRVVLLTQEEWKQMQQLALEGPSLVAPEDLEQLEYDLTAAIDNIPSEVRANVLRPYVARMLELAFGNSADCIEKFAPFGMPTRIDQVAAVYARVVRNEELFGRYVSLNVRNLLHCPPLKLEESEQEQGDDASRQDVDDETDSALRKLKAAAAEAAHERAQQAATKYLPPATFITREDLDSPCLLGRPPLVLQCANTENGTSTEPISEEASARVFDMIEAVSPCGVQSTSTMLGILTRSGGLSNFSRVVGRWFPRYMSHHDMALDFLLFSHDAPLPVHERLLVGLIAAARHRCAYMFARFLLHLTVYTPPQEESTVKQWLADPVQFLPERFKAVQYFNALSAHTPWKLTKEHVEELIKAGYTVAQVFQVCCILSVVHGANGLVQAIGLNLDAAVAAVCPSYYSIDGIQIVTSQGQQIPSVAMSADGNNTTSDCASGAQDSANSTAAESLPAAQQQMQLPSFGGVDFEKYSGVPEIKYQKRITRGNAPSTSSPSPSLSNSSAPTTPAVVTPTASHPKDEETYPSLKHSEFNFTDHGSILLNTFYPSSAEMIGNVNEATRNMCFSLRCQACSAEGAGSEAAVDTAQQTQQQLSEGTSPEPRGTSSSLPQSHIMPFHELGDCSTNHELHLLEAAVGDLKRFSRYLDAYVCNVFGVALDDFDYATINNKLPRAVKEYVHKLTTRPHEITVRDFAGLDQMVVPLSDSAIAAALASGGGNVQQQRVISLTPRGKLLVAITAAESRKSVELTRQLYAISQYLQSK